MRELPRTFDAVRRPRHPLLVVLTAIVAVLAGITATVGLLARGDGSAVLVTGSRGETYEMATTGVYANNALQVVAEGVGWDVFTLLVAAPALALAAVWVARGSYRASLVAAGLHGYFLYLYLEYAVTWAFGPMFPLYVALCAMSLVGVIGFATLLARDPHQIGERFPARSWAALGGGMALLLTAMWTMRVADGLVAGDAVELYGHTTMTVQALDLGLIVPLLLVLAIGAVRRDPAALIGSAALVVTFVAMSGALVAMMASSWIVTEVPAIEPIAVFALAGLAGLAVARRMFGAIRPVAAPDGRTAGGFMAIGAEPVTG